MKLFVLVEGTHKVCAYIKERFDDEGNVTKTECAYLEQFQDLRSGVHEMHCQALQETFDNYSRDGTSRLPGEQFKSASSPKNDVFEFKRGRIRAYCFRDTQNNVVVLTCCLIKKDKPDPLEVKHARKLYKQYLEDLAKNQVEYVYKT